MLLQTLLSSSLAESQVFSPEEAAFLRQANDLDYQLYEYARTVARQLTAQAAPKVGSSGT